MKAVRNLLRHGARLGAFVPFAALLCAPSSASAAALLGTAQSFAVLGASTTTNTDATTINGDVGVFSGTSITGAGTITLIAPSTFQIGNAVALGAQSDAATAFNSLAALPFTSDLTGQDLGSVGVLAPGVFKYDSSAQLTGTLTLDFAGASNKEFVFQIGSTLTTASASDVIVENGNSTDSVYFEVGSSATLGTTTDFAGNILAEASITLNTGADILCGRAFALTGAVTMDGDTISNDCTAFNGDTSSTDFGSSGFSGVSSSSTGGSGTTTVPEPPSALLFATGMISIAALMLVLQRRY